ncbi:hypothetical protein EZV62_023572 [Acer yangbiense]|uniref:CCHC-type domain-containing protein n=1 Tax=Acer yangbiense TaxID=1000413 RepID=A0A5C7H234_9ROSI|nr:hypothetical protein EZV62_023572 [Acer yangbiense]
MPLQVNLKKEGEKRLGFRLIGKLLSNKLANRDAFMNLFPRIWRTMEDFDIEVISGNTFSFTFKNASDRWQVLQGGPWSFDRALLVLEERVRKGDIQGMQFNKVAFWVQIHNVPLICMTAEIGIFLRGMIGEVKDIDTGRSGDCVRKYIRVRVVVQVDRPLRRILRVDVIRDGKESVMLLKYEKLLDHCFWCGRLGHIVRDCLEVMIGDGPEDFDQLFGSWLKADSPVKLGKFRQRREDNLPGDVRPRTGTSEGVLPGNREKEVIRTDDGGSSTVNRKVIEANTVAGQQCISSSLSKEVGVLVKEGVAISGLAAKEGCDVVGLAEKAHLDILSDSSLNVTAEGITIGLESTEMEVDGSTHKSSMLEVTTISAGSATVQHGPKAGKWKRWARDGVKIDSGLGEVGSLGKRAVSRISSDSGKKQKVVTSEEENWPSMLELVSSIRSCTDRLAVVYAQNRKRMKEGIAVKQEELQLATELITDGSWFLE